MILSVSEGVAGLASIEAFVSESGQSSKNKSVSNPCICFMGQKSEDYDSTAMIAVIRRYEINVFGRDAMYQTKAEVALRYRS